jgi:aminopeptidase N
MRRTFAGIAIALLTLVPALSGQTVDYAKKPLQSERSRSFDALHYLVKIALDLERKSFEAATTVTLSSFRDGLEACVLDAEEFAVTSVVDEYGTPLRFEQSDKELTVVLLRPAKFGEIVTFTCAYSGREPGQGLKFVDETPDNPPLVWSDSWPDNVHHWFPCFDYPNDKATSEIVATVKAGLKVAANGRLVGVAEDKAAGLTTYHWSQDLPHSTYLIFLAAAPYVVVRDAYKNLPVNYWVYPGDEAKARPTYGKTPGMIAFFNGIFGYDYPWQKYDQISVPLGGGAESTSATAMTQRIMVAEEDEPDFSAIGIVSHELAHQWWGDLITLRSWGHAWMNESFGTYSDYLYFRHDRGDDEGAVNLQNKLAAYLREAHTRYIRPIVSDRYDKPEDMFDSHSYPKGALVLHMLRAILGDEIFFKTLSQFLHRRFHPLGQDGHRPEPRLVLRPVALQAWPPRLRHPKRMGRGQEGRPAQGRPGPGLRQGRARLPRPGQRQDRHGRRRGDAPRLDPRAGGDLRIPGRDRAATHQVRRGERADQGGDVPQGDGRASLPA